MKNPASAETQALSRKILRQVEFDLGIYLDKPKATARCRNQQFGVYDEEENHTGDIVAERLHFTEDELRSKAKLLFES